MGHVRDDRGGRLLAGDAGTRRPPYGAVSEHPAHEPSGRALSRLSHLGLFARETPAQVLTPLSAKPSAHAARVRPVDGGHGDGVASSSSSSRRGALLHVFGLVATFLAYSDRRQVGGCQPERAVRSQRPTRPFVVEDPGGTHQERPSRRVFTFGHPASPWESRRFGGYSCQRVVCPL